MNSYFEGWYYKHQKDGNTLSIIPGRSSGSAFIQVITNTRSYNIPFNINQYKRDGILRIGNNSFASRGISLDIHYRDIDLTGTLAYKKLTPIRYDIMGPFRYFPMECRHSVHSLHHQLAGTLNFNGRVLDFTGGKGYIESDRGKSFPESYTWIQSNDFDEDCSIMVSIAKIPFCGLRFWGCICIVWHQGTEYRLATYKGVRIRCRTKNKIVLSQGDFHLEIYIPRQNGHSLYAPHKGVMSRTIYESTAVKAHFRFYVGDHILIDTVSNHTSFEHVE